MSQPPLREFEERYIHLAQCADDLNDSWRILKHIKRHPTNRLIGPAFQFAIIQYAKSYKVSRGIALRRHQLDTRFVPVDQADLHQALLDSRDQINAHSDLTIRDARVHVARVTNGRFVGVVQNVIHGTEQLRHIDEIIRLIERTLLGVYAELRSIEPLLPESQPHR